MESQGSVGLLEATAESMLAMGLLGRGRRAGGVDARAEVRPNRKIASSPPSLPPLFPLANEVKLPLPLSPENRASPLPPSTLLVPHRTSRPPVTSPQPSCPL